MANKDYSVEIYPMAFADLDGIYAYYYTESQEQSVAEKVIGELKSAILGLSFMPKSHPLVKERRLRSDGFRKLICGNYVIPFLIDEDKKLVSVVRVFSGKMNYQKYL